MRYALRVLFPLAFAGAVLAMAHWAFAAPGHGGGGRGSGGTGRGVSGASHGISGSARGFSGGGHSISGSSRGFSSSGRGSSGMGPSTSGSARGSSAGTSVGSSGPRFGGQALSPSGPTRGIAPPTGTLSPSRPSMPLRSVTPSQSGSGFRAQGSPPSLGTRPSAAASHTVGLGATHNVGAGAVKPGVGPSVGSAGTNRHFDGHGRRSSGDFAPHGDFKHLHHGDSKHFQHGDFKHRHHHDFKDFKHFQHRHVKFLFPVSVWPFWFPYGDVYYPHSTYGYPTATYEYAYPYPVSEYRSASPSAEYVDTDESAAATGQFFEQAVEAFRRGDYAEAFRLGNHAAVDAPRDPRVPELLSLVLLAQGDYPGAAAAAHAALTLGPAADWPRLYAYYGDAAAYSRQLDALASHVRENPGSPEARFLLAYHDLMMGHLDAAKEQFAAAVQLDPEDKLAQQLLDRLKESPAAPAPGAKTF